MGERLRLVSGREPVAKHVGRGNAPALGRNP